LATIEEQGRKQGQ